MSANWPIHHAGLFSVQIPLDWSSQPSGPSTFIIADQVNGISLTLLAVSRDPENLVPVEPSRELQNWVDSQHHVRLLGPAHAISGLQYPAATAEGTQQRRASTRWYRRLLQRFDSRPVTQWRFWAIAAPRLLIFASCHGEPRDIESYRQTLDHIIATITLPPADLLTGRRFTEKVVSLARSWFPSTSVSLVDDGHLQFGQRSLSVAGLHRNYLARPEELSSQVRAFLHAIHVEMPASQVADSWENAAEQVLPVFLTRETLNNALGRVAHEEWINGLFLAHVLEEGGGAPELPGAGGRLITIDDISRWGVEADALHEQALRNLVVDSHEQVMEGRKEHGTILLSLVNSNPHNAVRVLLPELHQKLREHLGPTFYAAMPAADALIAFSTHDPQVLASIRVKISEEFRRSPRPLSPQLFLMTPDGIAGDPGDHDR